MRLQARVRLSEFRRLAMASPGDSSVALDSQRQLPVIRRSNERSQTLFCEVGLIYVLGHLVCLMSLARHGAFMTGLFSDLQLTLPSC